MSVTCYLTVFSHRFLALTSMQNLLRKKNNKSFSKLFCLLANFTNNTLWWSYQLRHEQKNTVNTHVILLANYTQSSKNIWQKSQGLLLIYKLTTPSQTAIGKFFLKILKSRLVFQTIHLSNNPRILCSVRPTQINFAQIPFFQKINESLCYLNW